MHASRCFSRTLLRSVASTAPLLAGLLLLGCESTPGDAATDVATDLTDAADASDVADDATETTGDDTAVDTFVDTTPDPCNAAFVAQGSVGQVFVTHATPDQALELRTADGAVLATAKADYLGSHVFRKVAPGNDYRVWAPNAGPTDCSAAVDVLGSAASLPPPTFYAAQKILPGYGYLTMRDGTTLAYFATLPGPVEKGPYPTIVNYSGYSPARPGEPVVGEDQKFFCDLIPVLCDAPSDPNALLMAVGGYATVNVNIRGTGCSGGAYDYFEELQLLDGYDVIEIAAAQDWVLHHHVGMVGLSYPGITQLFVAKMQPPGLAAITPLSVIGNTATTLVPGGILNDGFALSWIENVFAKAAPYGQGWEQARVDGGDNICKENQLLHDQRVDNVEQAKSTANYTPELMVPLNPSGWADQIQVPVFLTGSWQDEQTGPFFFTLLDKLVNAPDRRFMVYNGVHSDGFAPQVVAEWKAFLDLFVARRVPELPTYLALLAPQFTNSVYGVEMQLPANRFASFKSYDEALAAWRKESELVVLFENGAGPQVGAPEANFRMDFPSWPPQAQTQRWYFQADGALLPSPPTQTESACSFALDPDAGHRTMDVQGTWQHDAKIKWKPIAQGNEVAFLSPPLEQDMVYAGTGSVDLWLRTTDPQVTDADLEVNLSEVRPDGQERYVQSGWLRASFRKLSAAATALWPEPAMYLPDLQPLPVGQWTPMRVAIAGFSHPFRKGSRIRIAIDTPGDSRAEWRFNLLEFGKPVKYDIAHTAAFPSSVALPLLPAAQIPAGKPLPPCPSLRAQPCRAFVQVPNAPAAF